MAFDKYKIYVQLNLLEYLEHSGYMQTIGNECMNYAIKMLNPVNKYDTLYCPVKINLFKLGEYSVTMLELLLKEPGLFQYMVNELISTLVYITMHNPKSPVQKTQIESPIVIDNFPNICINKNLKLGFFVFSGILSQTFSKQVYVRNSTWKCQADCCKNQLSVVYKKLPSSKPLCKYCAEDIEEELSLRSYGNTWKASFYIKDFISELKPEIEVCFYDARACEVPLTLGCNYKVAGVRRCDYIEAWGISNIKNCNSLTDNSLKVNQIKSEFKEDSWDFTILLANAMGKGSFPSNLHIQFRIALLLSLASIKCTKPISIFAISNDSRILEKFMIESLKYSLRNNTFSTNLDGHSQNGSARAGSLLLSRNGVCFVGDWMGHKTKDKTAILKAIESNSITVEDGSTINSRCIVWTYTQLPYKTTDKEQLYSMYKSFGLTWKVDPTSEDESILVDNMLNDSTPSQLTDDDIISYIQFIDGFEVTLSEDALELVQKYFVCTRRARGEALPLISLEPLISLTEAHARLNQRTLATLEDVFVAIYLCEYSLGECATIGSVPKSIPDVKMWLENNLFPFYSQISQTQFSETFSNLGF